MNKNYDLLYLGGGAATLMSASEVNQNSKLNIAIVDANDKLGAKLKISGGGKCNITNVDVQNYHYDGNKFFVNEVFKQFNKNDLLNFLEKNSLRPTIRKERYYFCRDSADEIISLFTEKLGGVKLFLGHTILDVTKEENFFVVTTNRLQIKAKQLVVATGGESFKRLNASNIGLKIAKKFGHSVYDFEPALCGLTLQKEQFWMKELSGISTPVKIEIALSKRDARVIEEDMLFAHKGISGPAILSASLYWRKGNISINFLPNFHLKNEIKSSQKLLSTLLPLPKRFTQLFLSSVNLSDKNCTKYSNSEIETLLMLQDYTFSPAGNFGFSKAEVSRGGVNVDEIDSKTMMSKKCDGLYFIGEVLNITGELGGYNFQWAFSSAYVSSKAILDYKMLKLCDFYNNKVNEQW